MGFKVGDEVRDEVFGEGKVVETNNEEILVQFKKTHYSLHSGTRGRNGPYEDQTCYWYSKDTTNLKKIKDYTYEDLKKSPIGTKIIFENKKCLIKENSSYEEDCFFNNSCSRSIKNLKGLKDSAPYGTLGKIIKIEEPIYQTVYEYKPEILDDVEKRYLKQVIRPYKNIKSIVKYIYPGERIASIMITILDLDNEDWTFTLPPFKTYEMYKNMEDDKEYTLQELGL